MSKRKAESGAKTGVKRQSPAKSKVNAKKTTPDDTDASKVDADAARTKAAATSRTSTAVTAQAGTAEGSSAAATTTASSQSAGLKRWAIPGAIAAGLAGAGLWYSQSGPDPSTTTETTAASGIAQEKTVETTASVGGAAPGQALGEPTSPQAVTGPESGDAASDSAQIAKTPRADAPQDVAESGMESPATPVTEPVPAAKPQVGEPSAVAGAVTTTTVDAAYYDQWGRVMTRAMNPVTYFQMMAAMTQGAMNAANGSAEPANDSNKANK
jgi:hypothetical protein